MPQKKVQWAVILRQGRTERIVFTLLPVLFIAMIGIFAWDFRDDPENLSSLAALLCIALIFLVPVTFYMRHWRMVLDEDGLHRRRLFRWVSHSWADLTKITQSSDAKGNGQLWIYFSNDEPWYLMSRYNGYYPARMLLQKHKSIELRDKNI